MKIKPLPIRSLCCAPFASIPVVTLCGLGTSDAGIASDFGAGLFFSAILAVPLAALGLLLVGLPLFVVLRQHNAFLLPIACVLGAVIPHALFHGAPGRMAFAAGAAGFAVAVTAYLLRPAAPKN